LKNTSPSKRAKEKAITGYFSRMKAKDLFIQSKSSECPQIQGNLEYLIRSDEDLRQATQKQEAYLNGQEKSVAGTVLGTIADFPQKKGLNNVV
jgi:hypothetical protein